MKKILCFFAAIIFASTISGQTVIVINDQAPKPIAFKDVNIEGELLTRAMKNLDRLESDIYTPANVFPVKQDVNSEGWPGDKEGRTILGLVMEAQATHREPVYLAEMIRIMPSKLNAKGYLGAIQGDTLNEQQLSGHGWFLRGLCEYYLWKKDENVKKCIETIIKNLVLPTKGYHRNYPSDPSKRRANVGAMGGTTQNVINKWLLSSDVGCDFIFLDGVVQAYGLLPSKELKELVDEMVESFLKIDLVSIKAQTHATLTGLRALVRYSEITGDCRYILEAEKRYKLYRELGMTENYENFNWFGRPEWTEPCAIIDSYMLAVQLWQYTQKPEYLEDAQHIYYNGLCHTQRANGGFGCDNCPGPSDLSLKVKTYEAYWCCTMRGGEGLARAIQYSYFTKGNDLYIPVLGNSKAFFWSGDREYTIKESTSYPFENKAVFILTPKSRSVKITLNLFFPGWITSPKIFVNGEKVGINKNNGIITLPLKLSKETKIEYSFEMITQYREALNQQNTRKGIHAIEYGPLMLGFENGEKDLLFLNKPGITRTDEFHWKITEDRNSFEFTPIYHLMDTKVKDKVYHKQILF
jgi:uncharacterized protein